MSRVHSSLTWITSLDTRQLQNAFATTQSAISQSLQQVATAIQQSPVGNAVKQLSDGVTSVMRPVEKMFSPTTPGPLFAFSRFIREAPAEVRAAMNAAIDSLNNSTNQYSNAAAGIIDDVNQIVASGRNSGRSIRDIQADIENYMNAASVSVGDVTVSAHQALVRGLMDTSAISARGMRDLLAGVRDTGALAGEQFASAMGVAIASRPDASAQIGRSILWGVSASLVTLPFSIGSAFYRAGRYASDRFHDSLANLRRRLVTDVVAPVRAMAAQVYASVRGMVAGVVGGVRTATGYVRSFLGAIPRIFRLRFTADVDHRAFRGASMSIRDLRNMALSAFGPLVALLSPLYLFREALYPIAAIIRNALMPALIPLQDAVAAWVNQLRPLIFKYIVALQDYIAALTPHLTKFAGYLKDIIERYVEFAKASPPVMAALKLGVVILGGYAAAMMAARIATIGFRTAMMGLTAVPLIALGVAVVGLVYGFKDLFNDIKDGTFTFAKLKDRALEFVFDIQKRFNPAIEYARELIVSFGVWARNAFWSLVPIVKSVIDTIVEFSTKVSDFVKNSSEFLSVIGAFVFTLGLYKGVMWGASLATAAWGVITTVTAAAVNAAMIIATGGLWLIVPAIVAGIYAFYKLYSSISKGTPFLTAMKELFVSLVQTIVRGATTAYEWVKGVFLRIVDALSPLVYGFGFLRKLIGDEAKVLIKAVVWMSDGIIGAVGPVFGFVSRVVSGIMTVLHPFVKILSFIGGALFTVLITPAILIFGRTLTAVSYTVGGLARVIGYLAGTFNWLYDTLVGKLMSVLRRAPKWVKKSLNWLFGIDVDGEPITPSKSLGASQGMNQAVKPAASKSLGASQGMNQAVKPAASVLPPGLPKTPGIPEFEITPGVAAPVFSGIPEFEITPGVAAPVFSGIPEVNIESPEIDAESLPIDFSMAEGREPVDIESMVNKFAEKADTNRVVDAIEKLAKVIAYKGPVGKDELLYHMVFGEHAERVTK